MEVYDHMRPGQEFDVSESRMIYLQVIDHIFLASVDGMASVTEFSQRYPACDAHAPQEDLWRRLC